MDEEMTTMHVLRRLAAGLVLVLGVDVSLAAGQTPIIQAPVIAVYYANPSTLASTTLMITGQNFGPATTKTDTFVRVTSGAHTYTAHSADPEILAWLPNRVIVHLGATVSSGTLKVVSAGVSSATVPIDTVFHYDWFDVPPPGNPQDGGNAFAVAVDPASRKAWINQLFHRYLHVVDPGTQTVTG
jgi:hypothetical protein